jgi:hypothetical protein
MQEVTTGTKVKPNTPCCPECGKTEVYLDCTAWWNPDKDRWVMSDGNDDPATCSHCDWDGRASELETVETWRPKDDEED